MAKQASSKPTRKVIAQTVAAILASWAVYIAAQMGIQVEPVDAAMTIEPIITPLIGMAVAAVAGVLSGVVAYLTAPAPEDQVVE